MAIFDKRQKLSLHTLHGDDDDDFSAPPLHLSHPKVIIAMRRRRRVTRLNRGGGNKTLHPSIALGWSCRGSFNIHVSVFFPRRGWLVGCLRRPSVLSSVCAFHLTRLAA